VRAAFLGGLLSEREDTAGLTGFLTSMWLRGTQQRSYADFARSVENLAAEIDGFAGRSSLGLTLEVPSAQLDPALELFTEVLLRPGFDRLEIEHERHDTLAALTRREDRLGERAFDLFLHSLYPTHPYRFPVLGAKASVRRIDRTALESHHAHYVRATNCVVAVAGDVDPDAVAARFSALLADLPGGAFVRPQHVPDEPPREPREAVLRKRREQAHLVIGFPGLTVHDEDRHALEIVSQLLAGQGGRLFLELRDRRSLAYSVTAMNVEGADPGFFAVYIGTAPEKLELAKQGMLEELERIVSSPPTEDELRRAQHYLAGNFAIDLQRSSARAAHAAQDALFGLGPDAHLRYADEIHAVTKEDVLRVAKRVIDLRAYVLAVVKP
jgi:zinc protease